MALKAMSIRVLFLLFFNQKKRAPEGARIYTTASSQITWKKTSGLNQQRWHSRLRPYWYQQP